MLLRFSGYLCDKGKTMNGDKIGIESEAAGIQRIIADFTYALDTLDRYDYQQLEITDTTAGAGFHATYESATAAIAELREKFGSGGLFGNEKDGSFRSSIATIYQTFDGAELYPSVEEKAAMLLYLVVKNHSFSDGNNRRQAERRAVLARAMPRREGGRRSQPHRGIPIPVVSGGQPHPL